MKNKAPGNRPNARIVRQDVSDQLSSKEGAADTLESEDSVDTSEHVLTVDKNSVDNHVARSLGASLQLLADSFWYDLSAHIKDVSLQEDELVLRIELPFRNPEPSDAPGDHLARQEDVDHIRFGFVRFLKEQPLIGRRLANLFYSEFHTFLMAQTKRFHFSDAIRAKIERSGERRLAGRPKIPIPKRAREEVKKEVNAIYKEVLKIQKTIKRWRKEAHGISKETIIERLKKDYDRDQYPWSRYAFQNIGTLPGKRAYEASLGQKTSGFDRPSIAEPERWSASDIAALWTQTWFYREYGERYDLRAIKKLLNT